MRTHSTTPTTGATESNSRPKFLLCHEPAGEGTYLVKLMRDDAVLFSATVDLRQSTTVEAFIAGVIAAVPELTGQEELMRNKLLALASSKSTIMIGTDEHRVVDNVVAALTADLEVYQRGGALVRVMRDKRSKSGINRVEGTPTIALLPKSTLQGRITRCADLCKMGKRGKVVAAHPQKWLVEQVHQLGDWPGIRHLMAVSDAPVLRADGSVWQTPGYDPVTEVLFEPCQAFPAISEVISPAETQQAVAVLLEVVVDFRFESAAHRAGWFAALLTPLARPAFDGPAPLFLIDANVAGAGKGLLAQTISQIVQGREMAASGYAHDPAEMGKRITGIAIAGDPMVLLDNIDGNFGNASLDRALTTTRWKDRVLGLSLNVDLPLQTTWYATGNNIGIEADMIRRSVHIRLDVLHERPEERADFQHANLIGWVRAQRGRLLASALTILAGYIRAGRPAQNLSPFGSFEGWSDLVRQAVVWAGLPDPCATRAALLAVADTGLNALRQFNEAWLAYCVSIGQPRAPLVAALVIAGLYRRELSPMDEHSVALRAAIEAFVAPKPGCQPIARQLGNKLLHARNRVVGGVMWTNDPDVRHRNGAVWQLVAVNGG